MTAPVDVLAVLRRHVALAEQVGCREQQAEARALFDAIAKLIDTSRKVQEQVEQVAPLLAQNGYSYVGVMEAHRAALRAVGGAK